MEDLDIEVIRLPEILAVRHIKPTDDVFDSKNGSESDAMVAAAVQWAVRILSRVDNASR